MENKRDTDGRAHVKDTGTINVTIRSSAQLIHKTRSPKERQAHDVHCMC